MVVPIDTMILGASVILLATALGSGELLIWPYITTQAGVGLLWLATGYSFEVNEENLRRWDG